MEASKWLLEKISGFIYVILLWDCVPHSNSLWVKLIDYQCHIYAVLI